MSTLVKKNSIEELIINNVASRSLSESTRRGTRYLLRTEDTYRKGKKLELMASKKVKSQRDQGLSKATSSLLTFLLSFLSFFPFPGVLWFKHHHFTFTSTIRHFMKKSGSRGAIRK